MVSCAGGLSKKWNRKRPEEWLVHMKQFGSYVAFLTNQWASSKLASWTCKTAPVTTHHLKCNQHYSRHEQTAEFSISRTWLGKSSVSELHFVLNITMAINNITIKKGINCLLSDGTTTANSVYYLHSQSVNNRQWWRYVVAKQCKCTASLLPCTASCTACILE